MKQKKLRKPLSLLLALALVLTMFAGLSITAYAEDSCEEITGTPVGGGMLPGTYYRVNVVYYTVIDDFVTLCYSIDKASDTTPVISKIVVNDGTSDVQTINDVNKNEYEEVEFSYMASSTPSSFTFKIYYSIPTYSLTSASSLSGQGGVTFKVNGTEATTAAAGTTVTATATALDGYTAALSSSDVTIGSDGTFTMPSKAVTVTATYTELATEGNADLDLEDSTESIPSSTTIDQYYIKTTADKVTTNNRVKVSWVNQSIGIKVASAKKWNPTSLTWETDSSKDGKASVAEGTNVTTFTFTNYSTKAFTIAPTFAINSDLSDTVKASLTEATYDQTSYTVAAVDVDSSTGIADSKYFVDEDTDNAVDETKLPSATVVATLNMDASKFNNASATTEAQKYGTYTFTLNAVSEN